MNRIRLIPPAMLAAVVAAWVLLPGARASRPGRITPVEPRTKVEPVLTVDEREYRAAVALYRQQNWVAAKKAFEAFRVKYKDLSPQSLSARLHLGLIDVQQARYDDAIREFRELTAHPKAGGPDIQEDLQFRIARAFSRKSESLPDASPDAQREARRVALAEYDNFLTRFPKSMIGDLARYDQACLLLEDGKYEEAANGLHEIAETRRGPVFMQARWKVGEARLAQGLKLLDRTGGREPTPEMVKEAMRIFHDQALPALKLGESQIHDPATVNDAIFAIGQTRLAQHVHAAADEDPGRLESLLNLALKAFQQVRGNVEITAAREKRLETYRKFLAQPEMIDSETSSSTHALQFLIELEEKATTRSLQEPDRLLRARVAMAQIFLLQKKPDECRTLVRTLQGQKALLEKAATVRAELANLLCRSYIEQKNVGKGLETWEAFRKEFNSVPGKGDEAGAVLPLAIAALCLEEGGADNKARAEEVLQAARADYQPWRYEKEAALLNRR